MTLPPGYEWLANVGTLPKMVTEALALYDTREGLAAINNPIILSWAREVGLEPEYTADSVPWCGLFAAVIAKRAGYDLPPHPLWALNWLRFGKPSAQPSLGDVLVFLRSGGGHVGIYIGEDKAAYHVLGGNTSDRVMIARIAKTRLRGARSPAFRVARPASSRPYILSTSGPLSTNEA